MNQTLCSFKSLNKLMVINITLFLVISSAEYSFVCKAYKFNRFKDKWDIIKVFHKNTIKFHGNLDTSFKSVICSLPLLNSYVIDPVKFWNFILVSFIIYHTDRLFLPYSLRTSKFQFLAVKRFNYERICFIISCQHRHIQPPTFHDTITTF